MMGFFLSRKHCALLVDARAEFLGIQCLFELGRVDSEKFTRVFLLGRAHEVMGFLVEQCSDGGSALNQFRELDIMFSHEHTIRDNIQPQNPGFFSWLTYVHI